MINTLSATDSELFQRLKISQELVAAAGIFRVSDAEARIYGFRYLTASNLSGLVFPYVDPIAGNRVTSRLRRDNPEVDEHGHVKNKYLSAYGDMQHLYFPPGVSKSLADPSIPVVFVEAEKSALALLAWGQRMGRALLPIGTGGCYGWRGKTGIIEGPNGERSETRGLLPDMGLIRLDSRDVVVLLDSNTATNCNVRQARWKLAEELSIRDANVRISDLPSTLGTNGPDDLIAVLGDEAFKNIITLAQPFAEHAVRESARLLDACPGNFSSTEQMMSWRESVLTALARIPLADQRDALARQAAKQLQETQGSIRRVVATRAARLATSQREIQQAVRRAAREAELLSRDVSPGDLIDRLVIFFCRRKYSPEGAPLVEALFTINSYVFDIFDTVAYLAYSSALPGSGKTTALEHLEAVCCRAFLGIAPTPAIIFRKIDEERPTLIVDEAAVLQARSESTLAMISILNSGYKKGAVVPRCEGDGKNLTLRNFRVFSPKVFARIGSLKGALRERTIEIHMEKPPGKVPKTKIKFLRKEAEPIRRDLEAYAVKFRAELERLYNEEPEEGYWPDLQGREEELWLPLLMHAKLAGAAYEAKALAVAMKFSRAKQLAAVSEEQGVALAAELLEVLQERAENSFSPGDLLSSLEAKESWGESLSRFKDDRARSGLVGKFLRRFRLSSRRRSNQGTTYDRDEALEVLRRHIPALSATCATEPENTQSPVVTDTLSPSATGECETDSDIDLAPSATQAVPEETVVWNTAPQGSSVAESDQQLVPVVIDSIDEE